MKWLLGIFTGGSPWLWVAIAAVLAGMAAWGGIGWYGKASAERAFADYQLAAARVITARLEENQRLSDQQARRSAEISDAFQKGKRDAQTQFKPIQEELARLRSQFPAAGGVRDPAAPDPSPVPGPAGATGGPDATACTDQPGTIVAAADRVVEDLAACDAERRQLISLQAWVREVCQATRAP